MIVRPGTGEYAFAQLEVLKGNYRAAHRYIVEYDDEHYGQQQHQIQLPVPLEILEYRFALLSLQYYDLLSGLSFVCLTITQEKTNVNIRFFKSIHKLIHA